MQDDSLEQILSSLKGVYDGIGARLKHVDYNWTDTQLKVSGSFYYLAFAAGSPTVDEFAKFVYWRIVPFCIPRKIIKEKRQKYFDTGDERYIHELTDQARNLFVRALKSLDTSGEPGEVVLFILLEAFLKAPQIACKMYLKTSEQVPVHGSDSIHVTRGSIDGSICLVWGESKIYQALAKALDNVCESLGTFIQSKETGAPRNRDIDVLKDHADIPDPKLKESLLKFFDPYEEKSNALEESYACFVGFDFSAYPKLTAMNPTDLETSFVKEFESRIESACSLFGEKLKGSKLSHLRIHFFLIPFPCVNTFRKSFFSHLGVAHD